MRIAAIAIVPAFALAACGDAVPADQVPAERPSIQLDDEMEPLTDIQSEETAAQPMGPGLYAVGDGTNIYSRSRLNEDGTYEDLDEAGEVVGTGTWTTSGSQICFDPEGDGEDEKERCWINDPAGPDGSFISRRVDGDESYRVNPLESEETMEQTPPRPLPTTDS